MTFSPFNPVVFGDISFTDFPHVFSVDDHIMIECFKEPHEEMPPLVLRREDNETSYNLSWNCLTFGDRGVAYYLLKNLEPGHYVFECDNIRSNEVIVTDKEEILSDTVLLQFCQTDNRSRYDIATKINNGKYFFDFRIPGGFRDSEWEFYVENEQFETAQADIIELYSIDILRKKLTIGSSVGVPAWVGELVNKALSCDLFYIDGERFCRVQESTPEVVLSNNEGSRFVYNVNLQQNICSKPLDLQEEFLNRIAMRRTTSHLRNSVTGLRRF